MIESFAFILIAAHVVNACGGEGDACPRASRDVVTTVIVVAVVATVLVVWKAVRICRRQNYYNLQPVADDAQDHDEAQDQDDTNERSSSSSSNSSGNSRKSEDDVEFI